jgi:peptidoglycan/LPS O-acetylase OafA/YrhL
MGSVLRGDIDGLRGVAVLAIIVFHFEKWWLPGGFLGVDMFFVLSGFLVSRQIVDEEFSLMGFVARRVKRIAPAVLVMLMLVLTASFLLLPGSVWVETVSYPTFAALVSGSNVFQMLQVHGYFEDATQQSPLVHLWSLAVEEQFYFVWPFLLRSIARTGYAVHLLLLAIALAVGSGQLLLEYNLPMHAYYLLFPRIGELGAGSLLFFLQPILLGTKAAHHFVGVLGLGLLVYCFVGMSETTPYPGWRCLVPVVATSCLLWSELSIVNTGLLVVKEVGYMSYSLYLYHWPVLALLRMLNVPFGEFLPAIGVMVLIFTCAFLSWKFVEALRYVRWTDRRIILGTCIGARWAERAVADARATGAWRGYFDARASRGKSSRET